MKWIADTRSLTLAAAKEMSAAAERFAGEKDRRICIAVVDSSGDLLTLTRMDGAISASIQIAEQKARTAIRYQCPTADLEAGVKAGVQSLLKLDLLPFEGGIPIRADGRVIGAIGVSGHSPAGDGEVAQAGADWCAKHLN